MTRFARWRGFAIVVLAAAVQVVDATGDWSWQRATTKGPLGPILDLAAWRPLVHAHGAVFILPPYPCVYDDEAPRLDHASWEIQLLASERALPINGTYCARENRKCDAEERAWATLALQPDTLYVLLPPAAAIAERFQALGARCGVFAFGRACSTNAIAIDDAIRANALQAPPAAISLGYGQQLRVGDVPVVDAGWTGPERGGRWTNTSVANLLLHLEGDAPATVSLKLDAQARLCGNRAVQDVEVLLDETPLTTLHFDAAHNDPTVTTTIAIPDREHLRRSAFTIQFRLDDIRTPAKLGCDADPRRLGMWLSRLWFE